MDEPDEEAATSEQQQDGHMAEAQEQQPRQHSDHPSHDQTAQQPSDDTHLQQAQGNVQDRDVDAIDDVANVNGTAAQSAGLELVKSENLLTKLQRYYIVTRKLQILKQQTKSDLPEQLSDAS